VFKVAAKRAAETTVATRNNFVTDHQSQSVLINSKSHRSTVLSTFRWWSPLLLGLLLSYFVNPLAAQTDSLRLTMLRDWDEAATNTQSFINEEALLAALDAWKENQLAESYYEASVDSLIAADSLNFTAYLHRGPAYGWGVLRPDPDIPPRWLSKAGFRPRLFRNRPLLHADWLDLRDSLASVAADHGYPFANVGLDSVQWQSGGQLSAQIKMERDSQVLFGTVEVPESARVNARFIQRFLGIPEGTPYHRRNILRIPRRLRALPYLRLKGDPTVQFDGVSANLDLPLERKAASRFDFVIGVLPNSNQTGKLLITGELNGELQNGLGQGERIAVRFQQLRPQTQELQLQFDYPYLLNLPFGLAIEGDLYRRDTQFINLNYRLAGTYRWRSGNRVDVFWSRRQTNLLGFDASRVLANNRLPDTLDVSRSFFGLSIQRNETDQLFNPRRGYALALSLAAGNRRIRRNSKLLDLGLASRYDSLDLDNAQYNLSTSLALYRPLLAGTVLYLGLNAAAYLSDKPLLANEQFRLGGAKLLRGFDEQQIFASAYAVMTTEFRLLLGRDAYLYGFGDFAYVNPRNQANPTAKDDYPIGFGAGLSFNSRAGIFAVSLALGRRSGEILDAGAPKVHFGYLSVF
jgi:outer membrane protein assembly factor BamA